jgi:hypothetical protein
MNMTVSLFSAKNNNSLLILFTVTTLGLLLFTIASADFQRAEDFRRKGLFYKNLSEIQGLVQKKRLKAMQDYYLFKNSSNCAEVSFERLDYYLTGKFKKGILKKKFNCQITDNNCVKNEIGYVEKENYINDLYLYYYDPGILKLLSEKYFEMSMKIFMEGFQTPEFQKKIERMESVNLIKNDLYSAAQLLPLLVDVEKYDMALLLLEMLKDNQEMQPEKDILDIYEIIISLKADRPVQKVVLDRVERLSFANNRKHLFMELLPLVEEKKERYPEIYKSFQSDPMNFLWKAVGEDKRTELRCINLGGLSGNGIKNQFFFRTIGRIYDLRGNFPESYRHYRVAFDTSPEGSGNMIQGNTLFLLDMMKSAFLVKDYGLIQQYILTDELIRCFPGLDSCVEMIRNIQILEGEG